MENSGIKSNMFIDELRKTEMTEKMSSGNKLLSLRKKEQMKKLRNKLTKFETTEKAPNLLDQNSYFSNNYLIQNFSTAQDKVNYLYQLIYNIFSNSNNANIDENLINFIIVQCNNYLSSLINGKNEHLEEQIIKFFDKQILANLIQLMQNFKLNNTIVHDMCMLISKILLYSENAVKLICSNTENIVKIFDCLSTKDENTILEILKVLYNCYIEDKMTVNKNCNISFYIIEALLNYFKEKNRDDLAQNSKYLMQLLDFVNEIFTEDTYPIFQQIENLDFFRNLLRIINYLIIICKKSYETKLIASSFEAIGSLLNIVNLNSEIFNELKFNSYKINELFIQRLKFKVNEPNVIRKALNVLAFLSRKLEICDNFNEELIDAIDNLLTDLCQEKNTANVFNLKRDDIDSILYYLSILLFNIITDDKNSEYVERKTKIIENLIHCLKKFKLDNHTIINIYDLFKEFSSDYDKLMNLIVGDFIKLCVINPLKEYASTKKYEIVRIIFEICLEMLDTSSAFHLKDQNGGTLNFIELYLDKNGFNDLLNVFISPDYGDVNCSQLAREIQQTYFIK